MVKPLEVSAKYACRFGLLKVSILEFTFAHERYMICISYIYIYIYIYVYRYVYRLVFWRNLGCEFWVASWYIIYTGFTVQRKINVCLNLPKWLCVMHTDAGSQD